MNEVRDLLIGIDIGPAFSQIACFDRKGRDAENVTAGEETLFPTELPQFPSLYNIITSERTVLAGGAETEPYVLLKHFLSNLLEKTGVHDVLRNIRGIMVTTADLQPPFARNLNRALSELLGREGRYSAQDHEESFFHYCMHNVPEIYRMPCCLLEIGDGQVQQKMLSVDRETKPYRAKIRSYVPRMLQGDLAAKDASLLGYVSENIPDGSCQSVFIAGNFRADAFPQSTTYLCRDGRRVFAGDNLFVKGACLAAYEKTEAGRYRDIRFDGKNVLSADLSAGIRDGEKTELPLLRAGANWFESGKTAECILYEPALTLYKREADEWAEQIRFTFDGLPARPAGTTRIRFGVTCLSADEAVLTAEDLGFGDLFPSTGKRWRRVIRLRTKEGDEPGGGEPAVLCRVKRADVPFYIESISANMTSVEELCYFTEHYTALLDSDVVGEGLIRFAEEELALPGAARKMRAALTQGEDLAGFFMPLFEAAGNYTDAACREIRDQSIRAFVRLPLPARLRRKGDALAACGKYMNALGAYRKALRQINANADPAMTAEIYNNMGAIYMRMLLYEESLDSFKKAYMRMRTKETLVTYLLAAKVARPRTKYEEILENLRVDDAVRREVEDRMNASLQYEIPEEKGTEGEILAKLMDEYRTAAGMPFTG